MDFTSAITLIGLLSSLVAGVTEAFKAFLDSTGVKLGDEPRILLIRGFALLMGVAAAFYADFDLVAVLAPSLTIPHAAAMVLSGLALALPADFLKALLQFAKASRDHQQAKAFAVEQHALNETPSAGGSGTG